ncbi:MAG TPA: MarR family transcriptional regulator [Mycobacteriales bacterium]|jgi:DNA-binding transcriptional regulator GbsR (MarR family)|nr:MarR family transcriptional regulator [Mycobacteriales bacterium]
MAQRQDTAVGISDEERGRLVEEMGLVWTALGAPRMEGRIVGYLMFSNAPHVSTAELSEQLHASAGSISTTTRRLAEIGFIKQVAIPGERSYYFKAEDDVWGTFLAGERQYLRRRVTFAEDALAKLGKRDEAPRRRLANMRDYMTWLETYHRKMLEDWEEFKRQRDANGEA